MQKAAVRYSERVLGRDANGNLKAVKNPVGKQLLKIAGDYLHNLPPSEVPAHAAAQALYGSFPEDAQRVTGSAEINPRRVRMHSTGFYAAPGEVVVVEVPEQWTKRGLKIWVFGTSRQHPHSKTLLRTRAVRPAFFQLAILEPKWQRLTAVLSTSIPATPPSRLSPSRSAFENALAAPTYVHGQTTLAEWQTAQRYHPAPTRNLQAGTWRFRFLPSGIRDLDDPTSLMDYWDGVVGLHDQLGGYTKLRKMPERINVDCQISVGLFHAGYPTQGPQSKCRGVVNLPELNATGIGDGFHELGHEAQRRPDKAWSWNNPYTFDGSIESPSTCSRRTLSINLGCGIEEAGRGQLTPMKSTRKREISLRGVAPTHKETLPKNSPCIFKSGTLLAGMFIEKFLPVTASNRMTTPVSFLGANKQNATLDGPHVESAPGTIWHRSTERFGAFA